MSLPRQAFYVVSALHHWFQIFYRSCVSRQHFRLRSFASLCSDSIRKKLFLTWKWKCNENDSSKTTRYMYKHNTPANIQVWHRASVSGSSRAYIQLFQERLSYNGEKLTRAMSKVIMGNGGFYGCLSEPQSVSAWWKETAQTHVFVLSRSMSLNRLKPQSGKAKLLLPIMPIGIIAYASILSRDKLCRNSCILGFERSGDMDDSNSQTFASGSPLGTVIICIHLSNISQF